MYGRDFPEPPDLDPWADPDEPVTVPGDTWQAVDLAETIEGLQNGTIERLAPTVGRLDDGRGLFYRGKVNGIAGASNCGKSWTALLACAQEIAAGAHVVYVDLEDDAAGVVERLLALGVDPAVIGARFHYVHPDEPYGERAELHLTAIVEGACAVLVVIDSTGESLALDRAKPNDDDDVARWFRRLPTRLARMGPAVAVLDHVVKADEGGLWPIGSQRKRAAISGAQYMQTTVRPFDRETDGWARLVVAKDRHGNYRQGMKVAELHISPNGERFASLRAPEGETRAAGPFRPTTLMERISRALEGAAEPWTANRVGKLQGNRAALLQALDVLVSEGYVTRTPGPNNAQMHESRRPYRAADDPKSDAHRDEEPPGARSGAQTGASGSGSLRGGTGEPPAEWFQEPPGNHSGTTGEKVPDESQGELVDLDERPPCASCGEPLGELRTAYGRTVCAECERAAS